MRLVWGTSADPTGRYVGGFVAARIPHVLISSGFGDYAACGVIDGDEQLVGGAVFTSHEARFKSVEVSLAAEGDDWLTSPVIADITRYPFDQLDCQRMTAITPRKAASARRFLEKFGFRREGLVRLGFGSDDAVVYGMLRGEPKSAQRAA